MNAGANAPYALLQGLRRPGDEPQLTQALAAVFRADPSFAAAFVKVVLSRLDERLAQRVPATLTCGAEEIVDGGRLDLRFRGVDWDVIVELKIHAAYGTDQLQRYLRALGDERHSYVVAITRDVPCGEPPPGVHPAWLGAVRWRRLLSNLRDLRPSDDAQAVQWPLFLDVLELEGSMGFTKPNPELFDLYARARMANQHVADFLGAVEHSLLQALREVLGGESRASFYFEGGGRYSWARWGKVDIPFRVPAHHGPVRVRAGVIGWNPPSRFSVEPHGGREWVLKSRRRDLPEAQRRGVELLFERGFDREYLRAHVELTDAFLASPSFEEDVIGWASERFKDLAGSGLLDPEAPPAEAEEDSEG